MRALKIFHALPLSGYSDEENERRIQEEDKEIIDLFKKANIDIVIVHPHMDPLTDELMLHQLRKPQLYYFGLSLAEGIAQSDMIVFGHGWSDAKGCTIEHIIAQNYDIPFTELDNTNTTELREIAEKIWDKE